MYTVENKIAEEPVTFTINTFPTGTVASCAPVAAFPVPPNSSATFDLTCTMGSAGAGSVTVQAVGDFGTVDATLNVTVRNISLPTAGIQIVNNLPSRADTFLVQNLDNASPVSLTFNGICRPTVPASPCAANPASANVAAGGSIPVVLTFDPPSGASPNDSGRVYLRASASGFALDSGWSHVAIARTIVARVGAAQVVHPPNQGGGSRTASFLVTSKTQFPTAYSLQIACAGAGIGSCNGPGTTSTLATDQTQQIDVAFNTLAPGDTGRVTLRTAFQGVVLDSAWISVAVAGATVTPQVTPLVVLPGTAATAAFTILNTTQTSSLVTFDLSASCTNASNGACGLPNPSAVNLGQSGSQAVSVPFTTTLTGDSGTVSLVASYSGTAIGSGKVVVSIPKAVVTVLSSNPTLEPPTSARTATFSVQNTGTLTTTFTLHPFCLNGTSGGACTVDSASVTPASGQSRNVVVSYATNTSDSGTVRLIARYAGVGRDTADLKVNIARAVATPKTAVTDPPSTTVVRPVTIQNTGVVTTTFSLAPSCTGAADGGTCTVSSSSVSLAQGASSSGITLTYRTTAGAGSGTAAAQVSFGGVNLDAATYTVTVGAAGVVVLPDGQAITRVINQTVTDAFTVQNLGASQVTYALTPLCTNLSFSECTPLPASSIQVAGQTTAPVSVRYRPTSAGTGTVSLTATGGGFSDQGSYVVTVNAASPCTTSTMTVTPCPTQAGSALTNRNGITRQFTVTNLSTDPLPASFTCVRTGSVSSCTPPAPTTVPVNGSKVVTMTFNTGPTAGAGTAALTVNDGITAPTITSTVNMTVTAPVPTPFYVVSVGPHLQAQELDSAATGSARFLIRNVGPTQATYQYSVTCTGAAIVSACAPSAGSSVLAPNQSASVNVAFTVGGAAGSSGSVRLTASRDLDVTVRDSGLVEVITTRSAQLVDVVSANPQERDERDLCLTISLGLALAYECGDLRLVHALPGVRTMEQERQPALIYNARHARPQPVIRADVTLPDARIPTVVDAQLLDSVGVAIASASGSWGGSQWRPHSTRRVAVTFDASAWPQGRHRYTFRVQRTYSGTGTETSTATGEFFLVNRIASPYGPGWWVAGLEELQLAGPDLVWFGGDGSARRYVAASANVWAAPSVDRPDTIKLAGGFYERLLQHGAKVRFTQATRLHAQTVNRIGHVTRFVYKTSPTRLDSLIVPSGSQVRPYRFGYGGANKVRSIDAPPFGSVRRADSIVVAAGHPTRIVLRDGRTVDFLYDPVVTHRVVGRINERGDTTLLSYGNGGELLSASLPRSAGVRDTIRFAPAETRGLAGTAAMPLEETYSLHNGPRTDVGDSTQFWLDRFGAPRRIRNAVGDETQLRRTNATYPALVTYVRHASGQVLTASYDARGNIATVVDSATIATNPLRYATTQYLWDQTWDFVTRVTQPEGDFEERSYDPANGNLLWRQDGRGPSTRTTFSYWTSGAGLGMLRRATTAAGTFDSLAYEGQRGNVFATTSPLGQYATIFRDQLGRLVRLRRPIDGTGAETTDSTGYDIMDRDTLQRVSGSGELLVSRKKYDAAGNLDSLTMQSTPDPALVGTIRRGFAYDKQHRLTSETLQGYHTVTYGYDAAGNLVSGGRRPASLTYDALNRVIEKRGGDTARYALDEVGNLRVAFNAYARTVRRYGANGMMAADTQWISNRRVADGVFAAHLYGVEHTYDLNRRRVSLVHPATLRPTALPQRFVYTGNAGLLDTVVDVHANRFTFQWDVEQRLTRLVRRQQAADSGVETRSYDSLARVVRRTQTASGGVSVHNDSLVYDRRDRIRKNVTEGDTLAYSALGHLAFASTGDGTEDYALDALGLRRTSQGWLAGAGRPTTFSYDPNSDRLVRGVQVPSGGLSNPVADTTYYIRDGDGALREDLKARQFQTVPLGPFYRETRRTINTYDSERRLIQASFTLDTSPAPGPVTRYTRRETYRYDALGRRVWREMIRDTANNVCFHHDRSSGCRNEVTRTVWDGASVLYEVRAPADTVGEGSENDNASGVFYGRVGYTHGLEIDVPLGLFKGSSQVLPLTDFRGQIATGTCPATECSPATVYFPGSAATAFADATQLIDGPPSWYGDVIAASTDGSGLQYKRHRYYDPGSGTFTQEDPIGLAGGLNLYGFANGDPVNFSDPFGLMACPPYCDVFQQLAAWAPAMNAMLTGFAVGTAAAGAGVAAVGGSGGAAITALNIAAKVPEAGPAVAATIHGAQRLANPSRLSPQQAADVMANYTQRFTQGDGATAFIQQVGAKFNVVIHGDRGVITALKTINEKKLAKLAEKYEWTAPK